MEFEPPQCVNCLKQYTLKDEGRRRVLPLLLACGHAYCSSCLTMMGRKQKHTRHIMCPECKVSSPFNSECDVLDQLPPNLYLLGIMVAKQLGLKRIPVYHSAAMQGGGYSEEGISDPAPRRPAATELCVECDVAPATLKCEQCLAGQNLYCDICFKNVHASSNILRRHTSISASEALCPPVMCHTHPTELLKYFCQDDKVPICSGCAIMGTHKGHTVVSLADAAECYREQLGPLIRDARETLRHFKQTEKSISEQLSVLHAKSLVTSRELHISFTSLHGFMQKRELSLLEELADATHSYSQPLLKLRNSLRVQAQSVASTISKAENAFEDNLELAKSAKQLITELQHDTNLQQKLEIDDKEPIRFILDASVRKQLQKVGSISYTHKPNGEVSCSRGHSPLTLAKPSPSPRSLTPCSPVRSQNRSSSRSPTINSETGSPIPRVEGRRGERSRSASASPIPPVMVEETKEVIVTHMVSPGEFYLQYVEKHRELQHLMDKINAYCRTPHPLKHIRADMPCAAQFSEDKVWYRATIEEFYDSYATVFYTDFGNLENVTPDRLSSLPPTLTSPPPLCHHAMLSHLSPPGRHEHVAPLEWNQRAKTQFKALIEANIHNPIRVKVYKEDDLGLHVDILLPSLGPHLFSVSQKLITMGLAVRTRGRKREAPSLPPPALPAVGAEVQVQVSTAYSPHNFYVQMISTEDDRDLLAAQLDQEVAMARTPSTMAPQKGMFCSAQFQEDGKWYRAKVKGVMGEKVEVLFVDFGNVDMVSVTALKELPPQLMMLPMQAIYCRLHDVESAADAGSKWSEQACDYFHDVVDGQLLSMNVCREGSPLLVTLTDTESSQPISSLLVTEGLARNKSRSRQTSQSSTSSSGSRKEKKNRKPKQQPQHFCTPVITKQLATPPAEPEGSKEKQKGIPPCQAPQRKGIPPCQAPQRKGISPSQAAQQREIPPPQLPPLGDSACRVVQVTNPSDFHVHISSEAAGSLKSILAGITRTTHIKATTGDVCLSRFEGDVGWHRVRVEEELRVGKLRVKYLDYGNTGLVSASEVAALPEALFSVQALAVRCALEGVEPVGGARAWPMEVSQFFSQLVMEEASFITVKAPPADSEAPLLVQLVTVNKEGGRDDIGSLLVANSLATPCAFPSAHHEDKTKVPSPSSPSPSPSSSSASPSSPPPSSSSYLPAKTPRHGKFVIMVTYVTSEGVIYGHNQEDLQVSLLAEKLQLLSNGRKRVDKVTSLTPGCPCLARFRGDGEGHWYRARVEKCNEADNTAVVFYVDFGNQDTVRCRQLVDVAPLMEVPILAFAVRLANMDEVEWSSSQVSALADLITGQTLDGVVVEQSGLSGYPLVQLTQRGDDVYSQLVRNGVMDIVPHNPTSKDSYPREGGRGGRGGEEPAIGRLSAPEEPKILPELPQEGGRESSDMELAEVQTMELD